MSHTTIKGACHCGNIRLVLDWPEEATEIPVRRCGCTFCQKHGGAWTSHRDAELIVDVDDEAAVSKYNFGHETADFCVCSICGAVPVVLCEIDHNRYAVVNVNTLERPNGYTFPETSTDFEGEDTDSRLERRAQNWIPTVHLY